MPTSENWRAVYDFWFPPGLDAADLPTHWRMLEWWMRGGANAELPQFAPLVDAARGGQLEQVKAGMCWKSVSGLACLNER